MTFKTPLRRRMAEADRLRQRYRDDPSYRLHKVNQRRAAKGNAPLSHVGEIGTALIPARARCERGRFV